MRKHLAKAAKIALGIILIIAGIIGLLLPFIPGILLILGGLFLLGISIKIKKK